MLVQRHLKSIDSLKSNPLFEELALKSPFHIHTPYLCTQLQYGERFDGFEHGFHQDSHESRVMK